VVAILAGAVASALANFSEPDSIFYPAKRAGESVLMATTGDSVARATLETQLSEQRLREAEAMAAAGRGDLVVSAISDHYQYLRDAANDLSSASVSHVGKWLLARDALVQEESQSVTAISQKLKDDKDLVAGNQVDRYSTQFQDDRKTLDPPLQTAVPSPAASPSPASG
jgi:hypothetical protein